MPQLSFERHVPYAPERMFELVADLKSYPKFVPNCRHMDVRPGNTPDKRLARMTIQYGPFSDAYTSEVKLDRKAGTISADALDGPFHHLDSEWRFEPEGEGTCVRFEIDFRFSNRLIAAVAEPAFAKKQDEIMDAFLTEAERRYGLD